MDPSTAALGTSADPTTALATAAAFGSMTSTSPLHKYGLALFFLGLALLFGIWWICALIFSNKPKAEKKWSGAVSLAYLSVALILALLILMGYIQGRGSTDVSALLAAGA